MGFAYFSGRTVSFQKIAQIILILRENLEFFLIFDDFLSLFRFLDATVAKDSKLFSPGQASATQYSGQPWVIFRKNTVQSHFTVISAVFLAFLPGTTLPLKNPSEILTR